MLTIRDLRAMCKDVSRPLGDRTNRDILSQFCACSSACDGSEIANELGCRLLILHEAHFLGDPQRGQAVMENTLSELFIVRQAWLDNKDCEFEDFTKRAIWRIEKELRPWKPGPKGDRPIARDGQHFLVATNDEDTPLAEVARSELRVLMRNVLDDLPPDQKQYVTMVIYDDMNVSEVARELKRPRHRVERSLKTAFKIILPHVKALSPAATAILIAIIKQASAEASTTGTLVVSDAATTGIQMSAPSGATTIAAAKTAGFAVAWKAGIVTASVLVVAGAIWYLGLGPKPIEQPIVLAKEFLEIVDKEPLTPNEVSFSEEIQTEAAQPPAELSIPIAQIDGHVNQQGDIHGDMQVDKAPDDLPGGFSHDAQDGTEHVVPSRYLDVDFRFVMAGGVWFFKTELTQKQYSTVASISNLKSNPSFNRGDDLPVDSLTVEDIIAYCIAFQNMTGIPVCVPSKRQWNIAACAGSTLPSRYQTDPTNQPVAADVDAVAWFHENSGYTTHPVGQKEPNAWRLDDVFGNVSELVKDPQLGYVTMGGNWVSETIWCKPNYYARLPIPNPAVGVRLVFDPNNLNPYEEEATQLTSSVDDLH